MDPNLFHIDYERLVEVITTISILAILVERALSVVFESRPYIRKTEKVHGVKELITFLVCVFVCIYWDFDAITILIVNSDKMTIPGMIVTGGIVAGGSKGSVKLFKDVFNMMSSAERERMEKNAPK